MYEEVRSGGTTACDGAVGRAVPSCGSTMLLM
jgi:hypothetical protein